MNSGELKVEVPLASVESDMEEEDGGSSRSSSVAPTERRAKRPQRRRAALFDRAGQDHRPVFQCLPNLGHDPVHARAVFQFFAMGREILGQTLCAQVLPIGRTLPVLGVSGREPDRDIGLVLCGLRMQRIDTATTPV